MYNKRYLFNLKLPLDLRMTMTLYITIIGMTFSATNRFGKLVTDSVITEPDVTKSVNNQFSNFWIC